MQKQAARAAIDAALKYGGDYVEIFFQDSRRTTLEYKNAQVENALAGRDFGAGVRVMAGVNCAYAYTCDLSERALVETAVAAAQAAGGKTDALGVKFVEQPRRNMQNALILPETVPMQRRAEIARVAYDAAKGYHQEIVQAAAMLMDVTDDIIIATSEGKWVEDQRVRSRISVTAVASDGTEMQTGSDSPGAGRGFEFLEELDAAACGREAARVATTMLHAPFAPAGKMTVAIDGGFGGVIFHEACGHALEATSVAKGNSVFAGKLGQQIASEKVTAIDDGTRVDEWGSLGYDDEGIPTRKNVLIEKGILKGYMIDMLGGRRMKMRPTGNSRRQNYRYAPTSRMTNTYIAPGQDEHIIESMEYGLYAAKMGGGSVNPVTGDFNFAVLEGYLVRDGKIQNPVRGATLIGKGAEVLMQIDMVGKQLALGEGMCGSLSGSVPTCVGQPMIRVRDLLVGGRETEA